MIKRDAINEILLSLNELPLEPSDAIEDIPTAIIVDKELEIARKKILGYGWIFNTINYELFPNTEGYIVVPNSYLSIDGGTDNPAIIVRDWKLYDREAKSFRFTGSVNVEVIEDIVFDDIPFHTASYIVSVASLQSYINIIGNTEDVKLRYQAVVDSKTEALRADANKQNANMLGSDYAIGLLNKAGL